MLPSSAERLASNEQLFFCDGQLAEKLAIGGLFGAAGGGGGSGRTVPSEGPFTRSSRLGVVLAHIDSTFVVALASIAFVTVDGDAAGFACR